MEGTERQQGQQGEGGGSQAQEVAGQAREKASEAVDQAKEKAQDMSGQAAEQVRSQVDQRSTEAGERIGDTAESFRTVASSLREKGQDSQANVAEQLADRAEGLGSYLRDADADRLLGDLEDFGRRQPWLVLAGGVVAGIAAARFLKASSRSRYEQGRGSQSGAPGGAIATGRPPAVTERSQAREPEPAGIGA